MFTWFDFAWPWIGLAFAVLLIVLLFATDRLRSDVTISRFRDTRWLSFLAVAVYMVHNVEEYGLAADGTLHSFPDSLCTLLVLAAYPACSIPPAFFLFVNLPLVWIAGPLAGILSGRIGLAALTLWGVIAVNAVVHIVPAIVLHHYGPGLLTAVVLFVPLSIVVARGIFARGRVYRWRAALVLLAAGVVMHGALGGSAILFTRGAIPEWLLLGAQPVAIAAGYVLVLLSQRRHPIATLFT